MESFTHFPYAQCADDDLLPKFLAKGLLYSVRGVAAALLAPVEALKHLQTGRRVEGKLALSWVFSAAIFLCAIQIWSLSSRPAAANYASEAVLACIAFALAIVNGKLQKTWEAKRSSLLQFARRAA